MEEQREGERDRGSREGRGRGYGREEGEKGERVREWKVREKGRGRGERREEEIEERRSKLFCIYAMKLKINISNLIFRQNLNLGIT